MTDKEQINIYNNFLIRFHTAAWTHNSESLKECFNKMAAYSYSRTNSNGYEEEEEEQRLRTLINLDI